MLRMFEGATQFEQTMCNWNLSGVTQKTYLFKNSPCTAVTCVECP